MANVATPTAHVYNCVHYRRLGNVPGNAAYGAHVSGRADAYQRDSRGRFPTSKTTDVLRDALATVSADLREVVGSCVECAAFLSDVMDNLDDRRQIAALVEAHPSYAGRL